MKAWQHGLVSDGELEWEKRCLQLAQYIQQQGDAHIGYRDGEGADLARWAKKQRYAHHCNTLEPARYKLMASGVSCLMITVAAVKVFVISLQKLCLQQDWTRLLCLPSHVTRIRCQCFVGRL